jgi:hypothetical protein
MDNINEHVWNYFQKIARLNDIHTDAAFWRYWRQYEGATVEQKKSYEMMLPAGYREKLTQIYTLARLASKKYYQDTTHKTKSE